MAISDFSENLRQIRLRRGLTIRALADITGISTATLTRWEQGKIMPRGFRAWEIVAEALKVKPEALLSEPEFSQRKSQLECDPVIVKLAKKVNALEQEVMSLKKDFRQLR